MRLDWGHGGAQRAAARGDAIVIVDVLSFSTAVSIAISRGAIVHPAGSDKEAASIAREVGGEASVPRPDVPDKGRFSLSPATFLSADFDRPIVLTSPNGATACRFAQSAPLVIIGALVNARAVAAFLQAKLTQTSLCVTVIACGERWPMATPDGALRFALEDYLGAGAVIAQIDAPRSPEAAVCAEAFTATRDVPHALRACGSGVELTRAGYALDIEIAARFDATGVVPIAAGGRITRAG